MRLFSRLAKLIGLGPHRWPEGEALLTHDGRRYGTRLSDGTIVFAPCVSFTPLPICSRCQQAIDVEREQDKMLPTSLIAFALALATAANLVSIWMVV